jgi:hypothetical protein
MANDWREIPAIPTSGFKDLELSCLPVTERTTVFHSSSTTEQRPSRHFHGPESLKIYEASLNAWFATHLMPNAENHALLMLAPPLNCAPHSSLVYMFDTIRRRIDSPGSVFAGKVTEAGAWTIDPDQVCELCRQISAGNRPVMLLGTAFSFVQLLDPMIEGNIQLKLPAGSCVLETGGYKGRSRVLPKPDLHRLIEQAFGVQAQRIVSEYGMSELSSQAYDLSLGESVLRPRRFRFPPWSRVQIISPETARHASEGEPGLLRVFDLANIYSVMALQTEDLAIAHGDGFELIGRAEWAEPRGCSLMAVA